MLSLIVVVVPWSRNRRAGGQKTGRDRKGKPVTEGHIDRDADDRH